MELGADPHGVGVNQFLRDEGATVAALLGIDWVKWRISAICNFVDQVVGLREAHPVTRLVLILAAGRLVEVVQAIATFSILLDGDAGYGMPRSGPLVRL